MSSSLPSERRSSRLYLPGRDYYDSSLYSRQSGHPPVGRLKNTNIQVSWSGSQTGSKMISAG